MQAPATAAIPADIIASATMSTGCSTRTATEAPPKPGGTGWPQRRGLVAHDNAADGQRLLDRAQAQPEAEVEPDRLTDHLGRVPAAGVRRLGNWHHVGSIAGSPAHAQLIARQLDGAFSS
jgi:hypothetical protein